MTKPDDLGLPACDKTPQPWSGGVRFHHTDPQRRVPCVLGDMLCPRSADDIPPITPEAMASVQAALTLLANFVADRDFNLYLAKSDLALAQSREKARDILLAAKGLTGILRVLPQKEAPRDPSNLHVSLTAVEVAALQTAGDHVRVHMAHEHSWETCDAAMTAIGKVLAAARETPNKPT